MKNNYESPCFFRDLLSVQELIMISTAVREVEEVDFDDAAFDE